MFVAVILFAGVLPFGLSMLEKSANPKVSSDEYYRAISKLVSSTWDDAYFGTATLSADGETLDIDGYSLDLNSRAEYIEDELIVPTQVMEVLGLDIDSDSQSISVKEAGKYNGAMYNSMNTGTLYSNMSDSDSDTSLPVSVLSDHGYEVAYGAKGEVTITNTYQMARVVAKMKPGKSLPKNINAAKTIAGPEGQYVLQFDSQAEAKLANETLNASGNSIFAEPDMFVTYDSVLEEQAAAGNESIGVSATYSHNSWGANTLEVDKYLDYLVAGGKQNNSAIVAVLDTGLDTSHSYFAGRYVSGQKFIDVNTNDVDGHGTHVSGTVIDMNIALPNVKIMPVKVLGDTGSGSTTGVANGIRWASDNGAHVINMSLGSSSCSKTIDDAITYAVGKNVTVVVAAGNSALDAAARGYCPSHVEAAITVSAFDSANKPASFTNYGPNVDVGAPGVSVVSTVPGNGKASYSGTSMASPHIAGVAALLHVNNSSITPAAAQALIRNYVNPMVLPAGNTKNYGSGIVNIGKAANDTAPQFLLASPSTISANIYSGPQTKQLAMEYYNNGNFANVTSQTSYTSSNTSIATVSAAGLVTIRAAGSATITATYGGKNVVINVSGVSLEPLRVTGSTPKDGATGVTPTNIINLTFNYRIASSVNYTLTDQTGKKYTWSMQQYGTSCIITLRETMAANSSFTFTIPAGGVLSDNMTVFDTPYTMTFATGTAGITPPPTTIPVTSVSVSSTATVEVSKTVTLGATVLPTNATNKALTWTSNNTAVATVSTSGVVTGKMAGTAVITAAATDGSGKSASCTVTVTAPIPATSVTLSATTAELSVNSTRQLTATVLPTNASNKTVTWTSSSASIATVSTSGLVTAKSGGAATITATTSNGLTATCVVTVTVPTTKTFMFSPKGKQGADFTYNYDAAATGNTAFTVNVPNKSAVTISVIGPSGNVVYTETVNSATVTRNIATAATGKYTVKMVIKTANGNTKVDLKFVTP